MTKGFPRHIDEFAQRCAGRVNYTALFPDNPDHDHVFTDKRGKIHDITLHNKRVLTIEEAFNEVMVASWGSLLGMPVAPVLFDYQRVPDPTKHNKDGYAPFISSVQIHRHVVRVETVLEHAQAIEKGKPYKIDALDATMWGTLMRDLDLPPLLQMEGAIFHHAIKPVSELVPFMEWVGGKDFNASNQILDIRKVLRLVQDEGDAQGNDLGFYLCDFSSNALEINDIAELNDDASQFAARSPVGALSSMVEDYPSLRAAELKLARIAIQTKHASTTDKKELEWYVLGENYPDVLTVPVFAPHLDFKAMHKTIQHIQSLDDDLIRAEMTRLAGAMTQIIPDEQMQARLKTYADYMAGALIVRRDQILNLVAGQLSHEANPHALTHNPFELFQDVVGEEIASMREARRSTRPRAKKHKSPLPRGKCSVA